MSEGTPVSVKNIPLVSLLQVENDVAGKQETSPATCTVTQIRSGDNPACPQRCNMATLYFLLESFFASASVHNFKICIQFNRGHT